MTGRGGDAALRQRIRRRQGGGRCATETKEEKIERRGGEAREREGLASRPRRGRDQRRPCSGLRWCSRRGPADSRRIRWKMAHRRRIWKEVSQSSEHDGCGRGMASGTAAARRWERKGKTGGRRWEAGGREGSGEVGWWCLRAGCPSTPAPWPYHLKMWGVPGVLDTAFEEHGDCQCLEAKPFGVTVMPVLSCHFRSSQLDGKYQAAAQPNPDNKC
ncbi:uncharacterized protein [Triticum aestivum]|nr:uncharacterized protein LOC123078453 [Triticum aestivum]